MPHQGQICSPAAISQRHFKQAGIVRRWLLCLTKNLVRPFTGLLLQNAHSRSRSHQFAQRRGQEMQWRVQEMQIALWGVATIRVKMGHFF